MNYGCLLLLPKNVRGFTNDGWADIQCGSASEWGAGRFELEFYGLFVLGLLSKSYTITDRHEVVSQNWLQQTWFYIRNKELVCGVKVGSFRKRRKF